MAHEDLHDFNLPVEALHISMPRTPQFVFTTLELCNCQAIYKKTWPPCLDNQPHPHTMGNTPSSQSVNSKTSQKSRPNLFASDRASRAISFYGTPPGSLDLEERPVISTRSTHSSPSSPISLSKPEAKKQAIIEASREDEQTQRVWKAGVYSLINAGSGTVLDLSGGDGTSIIGFPPHHGPNQQWLFTPLGEGYTIRSVSSGLYLTVENSILDNAGIVASPFPVTWKIKAAYEGGELYLRIFWPSESFSFDLENGTPGTKVQLASYKPDEARQLWRVLEHDVTSEVEGPQSSSKSSENELSVSAAPTETIVISDDKDYITTTRTMTTVTTVTTVTKTPRSFMI
ncbi:hypothetical protein NM688_g5408 [Phlebia brevispora]|uniref:Uncharacterized protein n=1 Tax=Phlebia brevispora TaxID=194682 RepID=A0ACC1SVP8_9APHY|nr:hypothetical protein NM688_g5408 [Phlebia brevispora]